MGKIIASYLLKVHIHTDDEKVVEAPADGTLSDPIGVPTVEQVKQAVIDGISDNLGFGDVTVSLAERTDD